MIAKLILLACYLRQEHLGLKSNSVTRNVPLSMAPGYIRNWICCARKISREETAEHNLVD